MVHPIRRLSPVALALAFALAVVPVRAQEPDWVSRSNENSQVLLEVLARFAPEGAGQFGVDGLDEEVFELPLDINDRTVEALEGAIATLQERLAAEEDPAVRQDLEILIQAAEDNIEGTRVYERNLIPTFDVANTVFQGIHALLDDQIPEERRPAALVRLRKYAGEVEGYTPIAEQAEAYIRRWMNEPGLLGPFRGELEKSLSNSSRYVDGIGQLFEKYGIEGYEDTYATLRDQLAGYDAFVRDELMQHARDDFRLPAEVYAYNLKTVGVDMPVQELVSRAKTSFREIQNEMQSIAELIATQRGYESTDYRDVIRELKKEQLVGEAILPHYEQRMKDVEKLIRDHDVITLPERDAIIRLASEAESAAVPAPHMQPPRLIGNTGERGQFVLPLSIPGEDGEDVGFDDFTNQAASWTLTVHEGRPGHELQWSAMVERGVSLARALFAFNSVNAEGWALYAEAEMKPYEPLDGQLMALQHRLLRAARAYLDPGLQLGEISREDAFRVLEHEVVTSHAMALQEVERYTFWAPAQATAYFCGYQRLMELRTDTERMLGDAFDRHAFHDFILSQGLLPPSLLRKAVMEDFVPSAKPQVAADMVRG
ncbi:MAG: DUF885 domain-containing protein [Thermoanaerobaculia bacterium]